MNPLRKLRAFLRKEKLDRDMAEEMRFHLEQRTADHVDDGMSVEEARHAASWLPARRAMKVNPMVALRSE